MRRSLRGLAAALLVVLGLLFSVPSPARGAALSGGAYTYLLNGEEVAFPFDPISVQEQLLLPAAVLDRLGITVSQGAERVSLRLADRVALEATLGSPAYTLNGQPLQAPAVPVRLGGHLFLPAALLEHFGVEMTQAGTLLLLRQPLPGLMPTSALSDEEYQRLKQPRSFKRDIATRQSGTVSAEFTLLNDSLLQAPQLNLDYGQRVRLSALLQTHTLVLVRLSNRWTTPSHFTPSSLVLLDDLRHQSDLAEVIDIGEGDPSLPLAPGADRRAVLAYPTADPAASRLQLYYHEVSESMGAFSLNP